MKTKIDIRALKAKHRLELVMQETGERFEDDLKNPDIWRSVSTAGLSVDIRRQLFQINKPGSDAESGDVIAWLQRRYSWAFTNAIKYLQQRTPDPKQKKRPTKAEPSPKLAGFEDAPKPLDKWQEEALLIAGERIRPYFSWSWVNLVLHVPETRIEPTHAPEITACPQCGENLNWRFEKILCPANDQPLGTYRFEHADVIPVIAYSIKRRLQANALGLKARLAEVFEEAGASEALQKMIVKNIESILDDLMTDAGTLFVEEEDGVICRKCAWKELDFQRALVLCQKSAQQREEKEVEERKEQEKESEVENE